MKRGLFLYIAVLLAVLCPAQQQAGYVKTPGRLGPNGELIAGQRIAGATLYFTDITSVGSRSDGTFSFAVPGRSFVLTRVQKNGYELADRDLLGKTRRRSSEPFIVVVDKPDDLLAQRLTNERRLRRTLNDQLRAREDEIEALKKQQRITEDDYHKKLQELYASQEKNEKLISDMAERYARMDFDQLDDFRRRVAACIQNGDLTRADSLLSTRGNLLDRAAELKRGEAALHAYADDVARRQQAHDKSVAMRARALADFGTDCYNRAEICQLRHMNDSAAYYLELRANTDTLNAAWQHDAGSFIKEYIADYNKAIAYYNRILHNQMIADYNDEWEAIAYNYIGNIYYSQGLYDRALDYNIKSLNMRLDRFGENHPNAVASYIGIGIAYQAQSHYIQALEYFEKALKIQLVHLGENHTDVATTYNNIGATYHSEENYPKALEYYEKSLNIDLEILGESHPDVATTYNNIGTTYYAEGNYPKALEYYEKSLNIDLELLGENHPDVALSYNNLGNIYYSLRNYTQALEYFEKALNIQLVILGNNHPDVANSYCGIGTIKSIRREYADALVYLEKAFQIGRNLLGEHHPDVLTMYNNIAAVYWKSKYEGNELPGFKEFASEGVFIAVTVNDGTKTLKQGLNGEYIVLEWGKWDIDTDCNFYDNYRELHNKPTDLLLMQDNKITLHHLENVIGVRLGYKKVGKEEKARIIAEYRKWKAQATR